jgi:hypothetical protein
MRISLTKRSARLRIGSGNLISLPGLGKYSNEGITMADDDPVWRELRAPYAKQLATFQKSLPIVQQLPATRLHVNAYIQRLETYLSAGDRGPAALNALP